MTPLPRLTQSPHDPAFQANPYPFYERVRAAGDLVVWEEYGIPVTASFALADRVFRDRRFGREAPARVRPDVPAHLKPFYDLEERNMLQLEPPKHTRIRSRVLRAFTPRAIEREAEGIRTLCHGLIDAFPSDPFDLLTAYAEPVPVTVIARMIGVPATEGSLLLDWSHRMVAMYQARRDAAVEADAIAATTAFRAYIEDLMAARRRSPSDDLISALVNAEDPLEDLDIVSTIILLLNAGHEATVHAIGNAARVLIEAEDDPGVLLQDPDSAQRVVEETLRFAPPLHMFNRYALEPVALAGHTFEEGDEIGLLLGAANRDPGTLDMPQDFRPTRPTQAHLSLGAGLHFCLGASLARLELGIALPTLFSRCPGIALAETPRIANRYHFHGYERLMVKV